MGLRRAAGLPATGQVRLPTRDSETSEMAPARAAGRTGREATAQLSNSKQRGQAPTAGAHTGSTAGQQVPALRLPEDGTKDTTLACRQKN